MNKHFVLVVQYASGECAFPTDTDDLIDALDEFKAAVRESFADSAIGDKSFSFPQVLSAKIVKLYYRK